VAASTAPSRPSGPFGSSGSSRTQDAELGAGITRAIVLLLAATSGAAAANIYYAQPLLHTLGRAFSVSAQTSGLIVTVAQIGYVLGLAFIVPLGDLVERRQLITTSMLVTATAMVACGLAPGFGVFAAGTLVVGLSAVSAQVIVPMASSLARESERGSVVGTVMSGLLIGILLARTFSGIVAGALGWRVVFFAAAGLMLVLAIVLRRMLPRVPPTSGDLRYGAILRSVLSLIRTEPVLRRRMALGACGFGCFSVLWTALAFQLSAAPFHDGNAVIGMFGLAGVAGAGAATVVGRLADRGGTGLVTTATSALLLVSFGILWIGRHSTVGLLAGIVVLDLGVQGLHIANQSSIYALSPEARSRLTTAYMVAYFAGGAVLSAVTASLYAADGWAGVCVLGGATALLSMLIWGTTAWVGRG
jgi:predicted MFS family arabinose efflux permease